MLQKDLEGLKPRQAQADKENDYHKFLFAELQEAGLQENEFEKAEADLKLLGHSEAIKSALTNIHYACNCRNSRWCSRSGRFSQQLEPFVNYHSKFPELLQRLQSLHIEVQDIAGEIESVNEEIQYDPEQIEKLNERIHSGYKLFKKHNVPHYGRTDQPPAGTRK